MPEFIWADPPEIFDECDVWHSEPGGKSVKYIRADLAFTAADLMKAWEIGRDAGAVEAQGEGWPDMKRTGPSERQEGWWDCGDAIADAIRSLPPPTDLTEQIKKA